MSIPTPPPPQNSPGYIPRKKSSSSQSFNSHVEPSIHETVASPGVRLGAFFLEILFVVVKIGRAHV